jgi:predicted ATPase
MTVARGPVIRTPDQRLRVFVSSTLRELAEERAAVRAAIERLRLAPVMFELGARPHPPRELYRSYLAQSDVFVGIYADSYGWVAPDEEVSGLEDEYNLAPRGMPKLIYIKKSEHREARLEQLIARIRSDDTAAYLPFQDADELGQRVAGDLASLLAERFDETRDDSTRSAANEDRTSVAARLPVPYTSTIGRESDLAHLRDVLARGSYRVVSLIGPGGVGKSRLAIEAALANEDLFPEGTYFVPLEGVREPGLLLPTIAHALGIRDNGEVGLEERISHALEGQKVLIVLDNFEQIVDSAPLLVRLYDLAPRAIFLVTSRVVLRIRGEQVYEVGSLPTPDPALPATPDRTRRSAACALFLDRAEAAKPGFAVTEENASAIAEICRRLEGMPLAIELAAAKVRILTPAGIAQRLDASLPLLTAAARDLPERHRTMRATIDWSVSLLPEEERQLLYDLGVFATRFTLDAVEAIGVGRSWGDQSLDALTSLVDASLVRQVEVRGRSVFALLAIVREYALDELRERGETGTMRGAHADHYLAFVLQTAPDLRGHGQAEAVGRLSLELPNLRNAARHLVHTGRLDEAGDFAWALLPYWWISGFFAEVRLWMLELLDKPDPLSDRARAIGQFFSLWGEMWQRPSDQMVAGLGECVELFTASGDEDAAAMALAARGAARLQFPDVDVAAAQSELTEAVERLHRVGNGWGEALSEVALGRMAWVLGGSEEAFERFSRAIEIADAGGDLFTSIIAGVLRARMKLMSGDVDGSESESIRNLVRSVRLHFAEGVAYGLEALCAVTAVHGQARRAGALAAAAAILRKRIGVFDIESFGVHTEYLERLRERDPDDVAAGEAEGEELSIPEAVRLALPEPEHDAVQEELRQW